MILKLIPTSANEAAIRSRVRWVEFSENTYKYFLELEKRNSDKNQSNP